MMQPSLRWPRAANLLFASGLVLFSGCHSRQAAAPDIPDFERHGDLIQIGEGSALRGRLQLGTATMLSLRTQFSSPATIEADPEKFARVYPPLAGHLLKLDVELGDSVTQGQLLATMQSSDFTAAQEDYVKAKSAFTLADKEIRRQQQLFAEKIAAEKDLESAQNDYDNAKSSIAAAAGRLRSLGFDPDKEQLGGPLQVFAPTSGKVVDIGSAHGEYHNDPTVALITIADLSTVWLTASVQEKDVRFLQPHQEIQASVAAYPDETFKGQVLFIGDLVDPDTRTTKVRVAFANADHRLKPGMFATVTFFGQPQTKLTVPTTAVVQIGASAYVFVQVRPWEFRAQKVTLGEQQGDRIVVDEGLKAGDIVVAKDGVMFQ